MNKEAKNLTELRRQEQSIHGYSNSSPWYTGLSNAIRFVERAEEKDDPLGHFGDAWSAAYNLFMLYGKVGDEEYKRFNKWVTDVKDIPRVRRLFDTALNLLPLAVFLERVEKAKKMLLKPQGRQELDAWSKGSKSPDKLCQYFLTMVRDIRNTCFHPKFNPNSAVVKNALIATSKCLVPVVVAATKSIIENPLEGTTGRSTAYRSFLYPYLRNSDSFFSDYYLERLFPNDELDAFPEDQVIPLLKTFARQMNTNRTKLASAPPEQVVKGWCAQVLFKTLNYQASPGVRIITGEQTFNPTVVLEKSSAKDSPKKEYHGKKAGKFLACLIWVIGWNESLDTIGTDPEFPHLPITEVAHRAMTASDTQWAIVTNGREVRLLSRGSSHKPRCFLFVDLEAIVDSQNDEDTLRAFRYFLGLFSGNAFIEMDDRDRTLLDRVLTGSEQHGKEIGDELKQNVFNALEELGEGFLHYFRSNPDKLKIIRKEIAPSSPVGSFLNSEVLLTEVYQESLSLMYRLLFLFYAESRNLLPMEDEFYRDSYSLESIRDDIISIHDDPDPKRFFGKGGYDIWDRFKELSDFVNKGWKKVIPVYNGGLFNPEFHEFLEHFMIPDFYLAKAIDYLSRTQPRSGQTKGEGRKKLTYRDLDVRHLGSIYEGILEYSAHIAKEDLVIMKRGTGAKGYEEYVDVSALKQNEKEQLRVWESAVDENPDNPKLPKGCKVIGKKEKGQYFLVYGGRESKRKSSGSYYTPDYIVQYIVENTLDPILRGECRPESTRKQKEPLTSKEILQLKILDPAMGSGHFLVAATEYLARAYGEALAREGKIKGLDDAEIEYIRNKRIIAERCIYGVDINPMAVELAKLSMWLFTMDQGRPLSFLNHHLKCGNALIGSRIKYLGTLPKLDNKVKPKKVKVDKQLNIFEQNFKEKIPLMIRDLFTIINNETLTYDDIRLKRKLDKAITQLKKPFQVIADTWTANYFGHETKFYDSMLANLQLTKTDKVQIADDMNFFHWQLEFPEIWFDNNGREKNGNAGFDAVIGNPPYEVLAGKEIGKDISKELGFYRSIPEFVPACRGKLNLYKLFICLGLNLVNSNGRFSFIVPMALMGDDQAVEIRKKLIEELCCLEFLDVFPQKDNPDNRVFKEAKLSTTIFQIDNNSKHDKVVLRTHSGKEIEDSSPRLVLKARDIKAFVPNHVVIPSCRQEDWDIVSRLLNSEAVRFGEIARSKQGEVNETSDAKCLSKEKENGKLVLRGSAITTFAVREASQGIPVYINEKLFLKGSREGSKPFDSQHTRLGFQRKAPQNNFRRLIAAIIEPVEFCFDGISYITENDAAVDLYFILAYLNSDIMDWFFRIMSSGSSISEFLLNVMPFPMRVPNAGIKWKPLVYNGLWNDLTEEIIKVCNKPGCIPEDVIDAISASCKSICEIEAERKLKNRTERSSLSPKAEEIRQTIEKILTAVFGLSSNDRKYICKRRLEML